MLAEVLTAAKARGLMGVVLIDQGGTNAPYLARCVDRRGNLCDPTTFHTHPSPEAALDELRASLSRDNAGGGI